MSREKHDTFELAKSVASLDYDEFIDFVNCCGSFNDGTWSDLLNETIKDEYLSEDGKKFLRTIGCYALDDEVDLLITKYRNGYIDLPENIFMDFKMVVSGWWNDVWRSVLYG